MRLLVSLWLLAAVAVADDPQAPEGRQKNEALRSYYRKTAARYAFFRDA